ncbi:MAG: LuxR C-terminal-related transcriptional regulator, partial [Dehalococcoidia bacterium]
MIAGEATSRVAPRIPLTEGESRVLSLVAQGMSNQQIAEALSVSSKTVRNRLLVLFRKLQVSNRTEAALHAVRGGLVGLDQEGAATGGDLVASTPVLPAGVPATS